MDFGCTFGPTWGHLGRQVGVKLKPKTDFYGCPKASKNEHEVKSFSGPILKRFWNDFQWLFELSSPFDSCYLLRALFWGFSKQLGKHDVTSFKAMLRPWSCFSCMMMAPTIAVDFANYSAPALDSARAVWSLHSSFAFRSDQLETGLRADFDHVLCKVLISE